MILRRVIEHFRKQEWTAIFLDFIIVVLGVFIGVQTTGWAADRAEQREIRTYLIALKEDIAADREMLGVIVDQINDTIENSVRFSAYGRGRPLDQFDNLEMLLMTPGSVYRPYAWNRTTYSQLKSIGALSRIRNPRLRTLIADYEALSDHLDLDFGSDERRYELVNEISFGVIDYGYADYPALSDLSVTQAHSTEASGLYENARDEDLDLVAGDLREIRRLTGAYLSLASLLQPRTEMEIPKLIEIGRDIEKLIDREYSLAAAGGDAGAGAP